jgi:hypothetical protein
MIDKNRLFIGAQRLAVGLCKIGPLLWRDFHLVQRNSHGTFLNMWHPSSVDLTVASSVAISRDHEQGQSQQIARCDWPASSTRIGGELDKNWGELSNIKTQRMFEIQDVPNM